MPRAPKFWTQRGLLSFVLLPLAVLYERVVRCYLNRRPQKADIPVICVGNIVAGGAGKTPTALFLARQLEDMGEAVFILSRGFGGRVSGPCRVDAVRHDAGETGDEALMMAAYAPVIIGRDRVAAACAAVEAGASIIIMDDGFQNPFLYKDFSFLVMDGDYGLGNGYVMPAGPLRERPENALDRADAVIVIGAARKPLPAHHLPVFYAEIKARQELKFSKPLIAFAGIGRPEKFFSSLEQMKASKAGIIERYSFPDHHILREKDAVFLLRRAKALDAQIITTEKDMARLSHARSPQLAALAKICHSLPVELAFDEESTAQIRAILKGIDKKR